jgi:hypothetical protein
LLVRFSATPTIRKLYCRIRSTISDSDIGGRVRRRNGPDSPRALRSIKTARAVNMNILRVMAFRMRLGLPVCRLNLHAGVCRERFESQQRQIWALRLTGRAAPGRRPACAISLSAGPPRPGPNRQAPFKFTVSAASHSGHLAEAAPHGQPEAASGFEPPAHAPCQSVAVTANW